MALLAALLLSAAPVQVDPSPTPPNVLLIVSDDQGYGDVACFGGDIPTPALDRLAAEGARLTRFYVASPVCTPSRFALMTGRHPLRAQGGLDRVGMMFDESHRDHGLRADEQTLGAVLGAAGYRTGLIGKWHLGHGGPEHLPTRHGFEDFYGLAGGCIDFFTHRYGTVLDWYRGEEPLEEEGYATDLLSDDAIRFLQVEDPRPWLLVLAYNAPHYGKSLADDADGATLVTSEFGTPRTDPRSGEEVQVVNSLQAPEDWVERFADVDDEKRRYYAAMVAAMDAGIGRVLEALHASGQEQETLVLFTPDHGADRTVSSAGSNGALRGAKHSLWEGGLRVPAILRWPGRVEAGTDVEQVSSTLDLLPTLAGIGGGEFSPGALDGIDLRSSWTEGAAVERELYWRHGGRTAFLAGDWKLHGEALFDLGADPGETTDLAADQPDRLAELRAARDRRRAWLGTPR